MSTQDFTQIARQIVTGYSKSDWNGLKNILAPDAVYNELGTQRRIQGPDAIVTALQTWKKTMSDSKGEITNVFIGENQALLEIVWQGTQDGAFTGPTGTLPPTNKFQKTPAAMVVRFKNGKVGEIHHYFDMLSFLTQLGALPAAALRG